MSQNNIYFKANYQDIEICKIALKGLKYIGKKQFGYAIKHFKYNSLNLNIGSTLKNCYNFEFDRNKNIIKGSIDTPEYEEPVDLIDLLTFTGAEKINITLSHDETGEELKFKIDNKKIKEYEKSIQYSDLDNKTLKKILFKAISGKDLETIRNIYKSGVDINQKFEKANSEFENYETALTKASSYKRTSIKSIEVIKTLIHLGADFESDYAVRCAIDACNFEVVKLLVEAGANYDCADYILLSFDYTCRGEGVIENEKQYVEILDYLISKGASLEDYFEEKASFDYFETSYNSLLRTIDHENLMCLLTSLIDYGISCEKLAYIIYTSDYFKSSPASELVRKNCKEFIGDLINEIDSIKFRKQKVKEKIEEATNALHEKNYKKVIQLLDPVYKNGELDKYKEWILDKAKKQL